MHAASLCNQRRLLLVLLPRRGTFFPATGDPAIFAALWWPLLLLPSSALLLVDLFFR